MRPLRAYAVLNFCLCVLFAAVGTSSTHAAADPAFQTWLHGLWPEAQALGVSRVTLYRMLRRHSINLSRGLKAPPVAADPPGG